MSFRLKKDLHDFLFFSFVLCGGYVIQVERHSCNLSFSWADANIFDNLFTSSLHLKNEVKVSLVVCQSSVILNAKKNPNFSSNVKYLDIELPEQVNSLLSKHW